MKKFIKILLWVIVGIAAAVVVIGFVTPKKFEISRSTLIKANRQTVWEHVSLWKNFKSWSPWEKMDTTMTTKIEGTDGEVGSKYSWVSKEMGNGSMTIAETKPMDYRRSIFKMEAFGNEANIDFALRDSTGGTFITMKMYGENGFFGRVFSFFMNMNDRIGKDYEEGLASLKKICEVPPAMAMANYKMSDVSERSFEKTTFIAMRYKMRMREFDAKGAEIFQKATQTLMEHAKKTGNQIKGVLYGLYYLWDTKDSMVDFEVAFPVDKEGKAEGDVHYSTINDMNCATVDYWGGYENLYVAHMKIDTWIHANKKASALPVMEEYAGDPEKDPATRLTTIWYPIK